MSFAYKVAAFDLDGTLAESKQPLDGEVAALLAQLAEHIPVVVISGGAFLQFEKQFLPIWKKSEKEGANKNLILLPTSGTQMYLYDSDSDDWKKAPEPVDAQGKHHSFSPMQRKSIMSTLRNIISSGKFGIPKEHTGEYIEDRDTQITLSALGQDAPLDQKKVWDPTQEKRVKIKHEVEADVPGTEASIGGLTSVDVLPKDIDKAVGLSMLLEHLHLTRENLIYVGDTLFPGGNDYSVERAGFTTVPVNGPRDTIDVLKKWLAQF